MAPENLKYDKYRFTLNSSRFLEWKYTYNSIFLVHIFLVVLVVRFLYTLYINKHKLKTQGNIITKYNEIKKGLK